MNTLKLSFFLSIALSLPANGMLMIQPENIKRAAVAFISGSIAAIVINASAYINTQEILKNNVDFDLPENILKITTEAAEKKNLKGVQFGIHKNNQGSCAYPSSIICLEKEKADSLDSLLKKQKNTLSNDEVIEKNSYIATIYHELTHIERKSLSKRRYIRLIGCLASSFAYYKLFGKRHNTLSITYCIGAVLVPLIGAPIITNKHKMYDELKCDDGIPNQKKLLVGYATFHETEHQKGMNSIKKVIDMPFCLRKDPLLNQLCLGDFLLYPSLLISILFMKAFPIEWFESPFLQEMLNLIDYNGDHPSCLSRARRLRARIAAIEAEEKKNI